MNSDHYDINGIEYYFVQSIERSANGGDYYNDSYEFPYFKFLYTPIYFIISDVINSLVNHNEPFTIEHVLSTFKAYRRASFFSRFYHLCFYL